MATRKKRSKAEVQSARAIKGLHKRLREELSEARRMLAERRYAMVLANGKNIRSMAYDLREMELEHKRKYGEFPR